MRAIERTFAILSCFTGAGVGRSLQEISEAIGLAKSTTFRLVGTLEGMGYLVRSDDLRYTLTPKLSQLASSAGRTTSVQQLLRPVLTELVHATGENVALHCVSKHDRVCVDVALSKAPLVGMNRPGDRVPLGLGAASMVLMAFMSRAELRTYLRPAAKAAGCSVKELNSILDVTREQGYAVSHGGGVRALTGISAPIFEPDGYVKHALAIVVPTARVSGRVTALMTTVKNAARYASARLAGGSAKANAAPGKLKLGARRSDPDKPDIGGRRVSTSSAVNARQTRSKMAARP